MKGKWKKNSSKYVYENPWIKVREDSVTKPDGIDGVYGVVEQNNGACIVPVGRDGKIWMIKTYRYIFDDFHWELPAGDVEKGETYEEGAKRELAEELKLDAEEIVPLGFFRPSNGVMDQETRVFLAKNVAPLESQKFDFDDWDIVDRKSFPIREIDEMIKRGEIVDGYVMNGLYFYKLYLENRQIS